MILKQESLVCLLETFRYPVNFPQTQTKFWIQLFGIFSLFLHKHIMCILKANKPVTAFFVPVKQYQSRFLKRLCLLAGCVPHPRFLLALCFLASSSLAGNQTAQNQRLGNVVGSPHMCTHIYVVCVHKIQRHTKTLCIRQALQEVRTSTGYL